MFLALLSAALFGAATPFSKALLSTLDAFQLAGLLYLGAAIGASGLAFGKRPYTLPWRMDRRNQFRLAGAVFFGGVLAPVLLLFGLKAASAASVSLWLPLELVATAVLGTLLFRDHLGRFGWFGMVGVLLAGTLLSIGEKSAGVVAGLLIMGACLGWGFDNNFTSLIDGITPAQSTFWKGIVAGTVNLGIGLVSSEYAATAATTAAALGVGIVCYGASIVLYITSAQNIGATRGQMFFAANPFFGVILSVIMLNDEITVVHVAAGLLLALSLLLLFREQHAHEHEHEALDHEHSHSHDDGHHEHVHESIISGRHTHKHLHKPVVHRLPHWPDLHHRHQH